MTMMIKILAPCLALAACVAGARDDAPGPDLEPTLGALSPGTTFCPAGFSLDLAHRLCASATEAVGPFPRAMIEDCKRFVANRSNGSNACETTVTGEVNARWALALAIGARDHTLQASGCATGTSFDPATGYCRDAANVYGPFSNDDVAFCKSKIGGSACETNRIAPTMVRPKATGFSAATEIAVTGRGAHIGKLVIAIGVAEGTLHNDGSATPAYFGHRDSGIPNIGLWSCTVCGSRSAADADQFYYDAVIAPEVGAYQRSAAGLANHPMVAAAFFGLLVQSPAAALDDANATDLALITQLARGQVTAPVTEAKLLAALVRAWTVRGVMQWHSPDTGAIDPAAGRADQLRRLRAYESALGANGVTPYP
jgi:hypothetical protein